jgi:pyruvate ferredoxin oxidoreductase delta subunit
MLVPISNKKEKTGIYREHKPKIENIKCTKCGLCSVVCPDNCIKQEKDSYPVINYDVCTGCMICLRECPWTAITDEKEQKKV